VDPIPPDFVQYKVADLFHQLVSTFKMLFILFTIIAVTIVFGEHIHITHTHTGTLRMKSNYRWESEIQIYSILS